MIIGIGTDMVDIRRVEALLDRFGERFECRVFTEQEREQATSRQGDGHNNRVARYAKYIAAKEATYKALRVAKSSGIGWRDVAVQYDEGGAPILQLSAVAKQLIQRQLAKGQVPHVHLSLSDEAPYAQAFVVIEALRNV